MNTHAELKVKAENMEACAFNFYGADGEMCDDLLLMQTYSVTLVDGAVLTCAFNALDFFYMKFKLRPAKDN